VAQVIGYVKGKSAIYIARTYLGRRQNFTGQSFWARGYYVSTVGRDEATVRGYIKKQEAKDQRLGQLNLFAR
jgi:putative transposase